jgi:hypothetical protein
MSLGLVDLYSLYQSRRGQRGKLIERMREIQQAVNGDVIIPLPELQQGEKPAVANNIALALDQKGMRIASTLPDIICPSVRPNIAIHDRNADDRRKALLGMWDRNLIGLQLRRRARFWLGYGMAPVHLVPNPDTGIARWQLRNPLTCFPAPTSDPTDISVNNCLFAYQRPAAELAKAYGLPISASPADTRYEVIEYVDADETLIMIIGPGIDRSTANTFSGLGKQVVELERPTIYKDGTGRIRSTGGKALYEATRLPNRAHVCPVAIPGRITLDRLQGAYDGLLGMYYQQGRLTALELIAIEEGVFPDEYLVARPNETATIVTPADGRKGIMGEVQGGQIERYNLQPGVQTSVMIDRIERNMRVTGAIPSAFGGEAETNVRTGRRGTQIMSATVDYEIQEAQEVFAASLEAENRIAIAIARNYFGNRQQSFYVNWKGSRSGPVGQVDYTASELFGSDENHVSYSHAGSDENSLIVGVGQAVGMNAMSIRTAQTILPLIEDPDAEHEQIIAEAFERAGLQAIEQQAAAGALSLDDLAYMYSQTRTKNASLFDAFKAAHARAQARQASQGPPGTPAGPAEAGAPEAQPGLAAGTPAAPGATNPVIPPPSGNLTDLSQLVSALHRPQAAVR